MDELVDVTITAESADWLAAFTRELVSERLAACGNIVPAVRSIYRWEGDVSEDAEALVILHTRRSLVPKIIALTNDRHPYDTPQVLAVPVVDSDPDYRAWVLDSTDAE
ncbi:divalent-cation tolerance protein CutA [Nocardia wallacei]|uniref:Dihydroorotate dehydrogenase n=1 Tax=Nocardia wallacei TaxID=480035 RepID=A0A7G1KGC2_9NOCA|nr:divalent-cation tolerance protein CutA [Nocardia wallacei]BCK53019.1 dihydroorotate dehydrogenase [Nocardia wallacei]